MRALTRPTIRGTSAIDPSSVSRTIDCTNATIRPRTSSATCAPMIVRPVRNAIPANPPTRPTAAIATDRCGASATSTSAQPAATMAVPNSRLCGSRRDSRGAAPMPSASPTNTAMKSIPYAALPPPRLAAYSVAEPTTTPPAVNAPMIPITSPRISGVLATNRKPSRSSASRPGAAARRCAARPEISRMPNQTVVAVSRYASPLRISATYAVEISGVDPGRKPPRPEITVNSPDAVITATP